MSHLSFNRHKPLRRRCLGIPVATLYDWRVDHRGPKAVKLGHALRYPAGAVRVLLAEQLDG